MAAPTPTTRQTPNGIKLDDGYQSLITFASHPDIAFWEKGITPPGLDGGDAIETTTMHNIDWRTMAPRALVTLMESSTRVAYDPALYTTILALLNRETTVTVRFPDGSTLAYYGFLRSFEPDELVEGTQPEATVNLSATNWDFVNDVEAAPVMTSVPGT